MNKVIADRLRNYRMNAELGKDELAEKVGVDKQTVNDWEHGVSRPTDENFAALADVYDVSVDQLLNIEPDEVIRDSDEKPSYMYRTQEAGTLDYIREKVFRMKDRKRQYLKYIPITAVTTMIYLDLGFAFGLWHPSWILFVFIPVVASVINVFAFLNIRKFNYIFFVISMFLFTGFVFDLWEWTWLSFLTIPLFYLLF